MFTDEAFTDGPLADIEDIRVRLEGFGEVAVSFTYVMYVATAEFATQPNDNPPNWPFRGALQQPLNFKRSLLNGTDIGTFASGDGVLIVDNTDAFYDFLIGQYAVDGRPIVVKIGRAGDLYANYLPIFVGKGFDWIISEATVTVTIRDNGYRLVVPAQPNIYGGTGGADGGADLANKRKPRAFGYLLNVSPPLVVPASLIYQINDGPVYAITAVYDRGAALTIGTDYPTYAALLAAATAAGHYDTCLALGYFKLGSVPNGTVTADVSGDTTGGDFAFKAAAIVRRLVVGTAGLSDPQDLYSASFQTLTL